MKIRKNHIHLFILLFAVSSLLVHSPPEAFAADGDITQVFGPTTFSLRSTTSMSLVQVDSDTIAVAYTDYLNRGFIKTMTVNSDGTIPGQGFKSLIHDTDTAKHNSLVRVDDDTIALAYSGVDDDGFISTFTIDSDGNITAVKTQSEGNNLEHDTSQAKTNSLIKVDDDTFALAYQGVDDDGFISTFTISADGSTIAEVDSLEHDTVEVGGDQSLVKVDDDTFALAYQGVDEDGFLSTFTIDSAGNITPIRTQSEGNNLEYDTTKAWKQSLVRVDDDTIALAYSDVWNDGVIRTFTISADGPTIAEVDSLDHDTRASTDSSLVYVTSDIFALAYQGLSNDGFISTFSIDCVGNITPIRTQSEGNNLEYDTRLGQYPSLARISSNALALVYMYSWEGSPSGKLTTFYINSSSSNGCSSSTSSGGSGGSSDDLINPKPYLTDEILVSVGPNKPIVTQSDGMSNIQIQKGDNITITLNAADDAGPVFETNTFSGQSEVESVSLYTNFGPRPNGMNLYYANHLNDQHDTSKTFYEWYKYKDDVIYDFENTVSWAEAVVTTEDKFTISITDTDTETTSSTEGKLTITFSATWDEVMPKSEIIVKAVDSKMGYSTTTLPFTLQVGEYNQSYEDLFGSNTNYRFVPLVSDIKVRESIQQWVDPFSGMTDERFVSSLGLHGDELPGYVKHLAQWVVEDKIDLADLIIAVEYIINVK